MPRTEVLAGLSLGTERPYLHKRFIDLSTTGWDYGGEDQFKGIAYDPRNRSPITGNPLLWIAGDKNKRIYCVDSRTMMVSASFEYPSIGSVTPATKCMGLAILPTPTEMRLLFLTEAGVDPMTPPILYHLVYDPSLSGPDQLQVEKWFYLASLPSQNMFNLTDSNRGMTEYKGDLMVIGMWKGNVTVAWMNKNGQILAIFPDITTALDPRGLLHMHDRVFTCLDGSSDPNINGRYLGKFLSDLLDNKPGAMIPLLSIEPFFFPSFAGDMTLYQDNMAACDRDVVYLYKMLYFCFVIDNMFVDDIDMGSVLIGDYKIKYVKFKNIADKYSLKDVIISKGSVVCPGSATHCPASEAIRWVKMSVTDPVSTTDETIWQDTIYFATQKPWIYPDGEKEFWIKIDIPVNYPNLTTGGIPRAVDVDDGPFCVPLEIVAKVG